MANYCNNVIMFCSLKKEPVEKLLSNFQKVIEKTPKLVGVSMLIFECVKLSAEDGRGIFETPIDGRHCFNYIDSEIQSDGKIYWFSMDTDSPWEPEIDAFAELVRRYYPEVSICYSSEEPGSEIYETNDLLGYFFPDKYNIDSCDDEKNFNNEYYDSVEKMVEAIDELFGVKVDANMSFVEMMEKVEKTFKNDDSFFYIHPIVLHLGHYGNTPLHIMLEEYKHTSGNASEADKGNKDDM